jgi:hypothetical protein
MASHKYVIPYFKYWRSEPSGEYLGWGKVAVRKASTEATSPKLLAYRSCMAREMHGKTFKNLKEVQESFKSTAGRCKVEAAKEKTVPKPAAIVSLVPA